MNNLVMLLLTPSVNRDNKTAAKWLANLAYAQKSDGANEANSLGLDEVLKAHACYVSGDLIEYLDASESALKAYLA